MKKVTLKSVIYQNYLKTTLSSIFFIEIALLFSYFYVNGYLVDKSINFVLKDIKESVYHRVKDIRYHINTTFELVENRARILQNEHENFYNYFYDYEIKDRVNFETAQNGMYYKKDNKGASVVVSKGTEIDKFIENELQRTEIFDRNLKMAVDQNDIIVASYYNSRHNYNRYYPFIDKAYSVFPSDIVMKNYNFYYEADLEHNPKKDVVWTDIYLDPAGLGWMISAIVPIYKDEILEGVTGLDITVNKLIEKFLNFEIPYKASSFFIDKDSNIVALTDKIANILNVKSFENHIYSENEKITKTIFRKANEDLSIQNKDLKDILSNIANNKKYKHEVVINGEKYLLFSGKIDKFSWSLIALVKEDEILKEVKDLEKDYKTIGYIIIAFICIFYILFFIFLYSKAKEFVLRVNTPLNNIIKMTKKLGNEKEVKKLDDCGIFEIDELNNNFNDLAQELEDRTQKLIKAEASRNFHEKLSTTDALTKVYNRRFLEDFSKQYFEILKREKNSFSLLLVDIDDFKLINDSFGHDVGDKVLIELVTTIKNIIRDNDFIVRLGGDEFLVLLPNTNLSHAKVVANKILSKINSLENGNKNFTVSIGSSEYTIDDMDISCLIKKADNSLYKAKNMGKNSIV